MNVRIGALRAFAREMPQLHLDRQSGIGCHTTLASRFRASASSHYVKRICATWCFLLPFSSIASFILGYQILGQWVFAGFVALVFIGPLGRGFFPPSGEAPRVADSDPPIAVNWRLVAALWLPCEVGFLAWALSLVGSHLGVFSSVGLAFAVGLLGSSVGAVVAHELAHTDNPLDRIGAEALMLLMSYPQFCILHVKYHHARFGTECDRAIARRGESIYGFYARTVLQGLVDVCRPERTQTACDGGHGRSARTRLLAQALVLGLIYMLLYLWTGWAGLAFFAGQSAVGILVLEGLNFVQHYGLADGGPSFARPLNADLAWNARYGRSNWLMASLGRHSEHHRGGDSQDLIGRGPELPTGYWTMFLIALVPPIWRKVMDSQVALVQSRCPLGGAELP